MMMMMLHTLHTNTNQKTFSEYKKKTARGKRLGVSESEKRQWDCNM